jgi:nucleoside-diphosphate-sugar epimerase
MAKTVLITGATGLLGKRLCTTCRNNGLKVVGVSSKDFDIRNGVRTLEPINYIIHLASPTSSDFFVKHPVDTMDIIFNGTKGVLDFSVRNQIESVVVASSVEVYGKNSTDILLSEESYVTFDICDVRSSYSLSKASIELLSKAYFIEYGVPVKIARLATIIPDQVSERDKRLIPFAIRSAKANKRINLTTDGEKKGSYIAMDDAVSALMAILFEGGSGDIYNITNPDGYYSVKQIVEIIARNTGSKVEFGNNNQAKYPSGSNWNMSPRKLMSLGWCPRVSIQEALTSVIEGYDHG